MSIIFDRKAIAKIANLRALDGHTQKQIEAMRERAEVHQHKDGDYCEECAGKAGEPAEGWHMYWQENLYGQQQGLDALYNNTGLAGINARRQLSPSELNDQVRRFMGGAKI